jgi:diguanylate cyclase (GGDEF)-like protein/PAS domain S-box-containing protein
MGIANRMKSKNTKNIKTKLIAFAITISVSTVLLTSTAFVIIDGYFSQNEITDKLEAMGQAIAEQSTASIAFKDKASLDNNLTSLKADYNVIKACIYDVDHVLITSYSSPLNQVNTLDQAICPKMMATLVANSSRYIDKYFPVQPSEQFLGTVYIAFQDISIMQRLLQVIMYSAVALIISILLATLLATRLQKTIAHPINTLTNTIQKILRKNDLSIRVTQENNDELGELTTAFNQLLNQSEVEYNSLKNSEEQFRKLTALAPVGIFQINPEGKISYVNQRWREINQIKESEPKLLSWFSNIHPEDSLPLKKLWEKLVNEHEDIAAEIRLIKKNGSISWGYIQATSLYSKDGELIGYLGSLADVSELKKAQIQMENLAFYDPLTGLSNRRLFKNRLDKAVKSVQRTSTSIALLFLDLDQFKRVNDTLGHDVGDSLLKEIANRLGQNVRENDTVSRIGGDEFTILLTDINNTNDVQIVANKILLSLSRPYILNGQEINSSVSIGITLTPEDSVDSNTLMKNADLAMYRAKELGRNNFQFFSEDMNTDILHNLEIEKELNTAIKRNQFTLMYQPKISLTDNTVTGVETLVRWLHPKKGMIAPDNFIPIAEETGQIIQIGAWVLEHSCHEMGALIREGLMPKDSKVAVNLSGKQFSDPKLLQTVLDILTQSKIDPLNLELEITESIIMDDVEAAIKIMEAIKNKGIYLSIDDFGTGYSSLGYLKRFPIDVLKVDRSFVMDIPNDKTDMAITAAVIAMAHKLSMRVVAEGIETQEQLDFLRENNCDDGQGYLLSRPLSLPQLHHFLVNHHKKIAD